MRWSEFADRQPMLAAAAHDQLIKPGVVLAGTTRRDGSARISGVEPLIMDGELWLSMMPASAKARDLYRDPRILLHSIITSPSPQAEITITRLQPRATTFTGDYSKLCGDRGDLETYAGRLGGTPQACGHCL